MSRLDNTLSSFSLAYPEKNEMQKLLLSFFFGMEKYLYQKKLNEAKAILDDMNSSGFNEIETSYKNLYMLYHAHLSMDEGSRLSVADSTSLKALAELCPGTHGPAIYQAIALYNSLYAKIIIPDCSEGGDRKANFSESDGGIQKFVNTWNLDLFPNPASNQLTLVSNVEYDELVVGIWDLSGRKVLTKTIKLKDFMSKLEIDLINGAYFIHVRNSDNQEITKKLLIAK